MAYSTYAPPDPASLSPYPGYVPAAGTFFTLGQRTYFVKAIADPNSGIFVLIPVLVQVRFITPGEQYWRRTWNFDPTDADTTRADHSSRVYNTGNLDIAGSADGAEVGQYVDALRCDSFSVFDAPDLGQKTVLKLDNVTGEGSQSAPANFSHWATHIARWYQSDGAGNILDPGTYIDVQYIDAWKRTQNDSGVTGQIYLHQWQSNWYNPGGIDPSGNNAANPQPAAVK